jgi:hypothetical protein
VAWFGAGELELPAALSLAFDLAAAICHAGIEADLPSWEKGLAAASRAGVWVAGAGAAGVEDAAGWDEGVSTDAGRGVIGAGAAEELRRFERSTLRLFNSALSSLSLFSLPSRDPSIALGIPSFKLLTSSPMRLVSSSRRREEDFSSETTSSTSRSAESRRTVRASSAAFKAAVSVAS